MLLSLASLLLFLPAPSEAEAGSSKAEKVEAGAELAKITVLLF